VAVDLAKMSLWLVTLAKDHALTFVDHALRHGDSLVGLSRKQIEAFHWDVDASRFQAGFETMQVREHLEQISTIRALIREADESIADAELRHLWDQAQLELDKVRLFGDLVLAAFFETEKPREREVRRSEYASAVASGETECFRGRLEKWRHAEKLAPFHWKIEFPEVFERENSGFDAIVGNPPFQGGTRISTVAGMRYFQWLTRIFPPCEHHCDLVAYFFRSAFNLLRAGGAFGLIATNTISQGDTREGGLRTILHEGGQIYSATRRFRWPGSVSVVVSVVHVVKQRVATSVSLDGHRVSRISAYLTEGSNDDSPARLSVNPYFSYGCKIYGQGFLFADEDPECTPLDVRDELLEKRADLEARISPYIGGEEILSHPRQMYHRYVIMLSDLHSEVDLAQWSELRDIVREKVKPGRDILGGNPNNIPLRRKWWAFQAHRPELYRRLASMRLVLATSQVNPRLGFALMPANWIFSHKALLFCIESYSGFGTIQSRVHEVWARAFSSTSIELISYTPSDCFETFPFPENWETHPALEAAGKTYYEYRAAIMAKNDAGLTKTYNRFHDPDERHPDIARLRELHTAMDRAVLDAYGWSDIPTHCEFLLDYEIDEEEWGNKKKPWRYRWPDEVRDEVLARLLELNAERAKEEARSGATAAKKGSKRPTAKRAPAALDLEDLFT
jgi:hypothetical protein